MAVTYNYDSTSTVWFDRRSTPVRLQLDSGTTIRRPTLWAGSTCCDWAAAQRDCS